jgi:hypothetical protein
MIPDCLTNEGLHALHSLVELAHSSKDWSKQCLQSLDEADAKQTLEQCMELTSRPASQPASQPASLTFDI